MTASSSDPIAPGDIVEGKYRVTKVVGRGGMGIVFSAFHLELEQPVALKVLATGAEKAVIERFVREAKAAALVKGEHVCRVFDVGRLRSSGHPFIVMEYLEGGDLARKVEDGAKPPVSEVVGWIVQACDALSSAHARGIVHRDIKPANLFLHRDESGQELVKVLDFGISKISKPGSRSLTQTSSVMGSPLYMSPEQLASSRDVDLRSDIWSLGVVMYELLTGGEVPFDAETVVQLAISVREQPHRPLSSLRSDVPAGLDRVVDTCLAKKPEDRYASVHDLVAELAPFAPPEVGSIVARLARLAKNPLAVPSSKPRVARSSPDLDPWSGLPSLSALADQIDGTEATQVDTGRTGPRVADTGARKAPSETIRSVGSEPGASLKQTLDPLQTSSTNLGPPAKPKLAIGIAILAVVIVALAALAGVARGGTPTSASAGKLERTRGVDPSPVTVSGARDASTDH
ncbi:MAG: serine/threonine protein kinase [Labilithrix sp.]|nr:serine/threonine protein kinase [Labilithrix sp.]MCW5809957.1 serine/threonine protein kinase [Labilithrix sp.]